MGNTPMISPLIIFFASLFTSNMVLANFLGMCSFISVSSEYKTASGPVSGGLGDVVYHHFQLACLSFCRGSLRLDYLLLSLLS